MTWNDVVSNVRDRIQRRLGGGGTTPDVEVSARGTRLEQLGDTSVHTPAVDVYENDKEVIIHADVPGGTREGTTVAWDEPGGLTLTVKTRDLPAGTIRASEYAPCSWSESIDLPRYLDGPKATSTIDNGVLTIHIPKRAAVSKRIPVKAG